MPASTPDQSRQPTRPAPRPTGSARAGSARPGGGRAPLAVAAAVAAGWAAILSYLPVAAVMGLAQLAEDAGTIGGAARVGLAGWLLGHGVPLETSAGRFGLVPLALGAIAAWRLSRAGVHASRAIGARGGGTPAQALSAAGAVGLWYGLLGLLAAGILSSGGTSVSGFRAALTLTGFGALAALVGALRTTGALGGLARRTPAVLRDGLRTGMVAALLLLGAGAGAAGLAMATGGGAASDMIGAYRTGVPGQAGITLVSLAYAPNAAVWSASYLLGPGFAVGTDTVVRTSEVSIGALPTVPLLAGLPHGPAGPVGAGLLAVPVLAGMTAGWLLARRLMRSAGERAPIGWRGLLGAAAVSGPVAGGVLGLAASASGGPLGGGRLAEIGPVGWQVAAVATAVLAVGAMVGAAGNRALATR
ncbi:DUF6350 family protein [Solwaraspora sp. WMMD1047]|uniref:cell division protein PerM n=1 Tax=Solwaraspora sp. WMMD1047 TaxID=3016102 RepID=UPI00241656F2|nr:DUF6350 family protein [Solwaraspora sp. WMMD1047]MDG4828560.1 DUF6350 family protein [Solwaraspora sp. WMMD1047]